MSPAFRTRAAEDTESDYAELLLSCVVSGLLWDCIHVWTDKLDYDRYQHVELETGRGLGPSVVISFVMLCQQAVAVRVTNTQTFAPAS